MKLCSPTWGICVLLSSRVNDPGLGFLSELLSPAFVVKCCCCLWELMNIQTRASRVPFSIESAIIAWGKRLGRIYGIIKPQIWSQRKLLTYNLLEIEKVRQLWLRIDLKTLFDSYWLILNWQWEENRDLSIWEQTPTILVYLLTANVMDRVL